MSLSPLEVHSVLFKALNQALIDTIRQGLSSVESQKSITPCDITLWNVIACPRRWITIHDPLKSEGNANMSLRNIKKITRNSLICYVQNIGLHDNNEKDQVVNQNKINY